MQVYRNMNQAELDRQYNVRAGIPDHLEIFERWSRTSQSFRKHNGVRENLHYAEDKAQTLDFFPAKNTDRPLLVFIHGGYWQSLDKSDFSYIAAPYLKHDINVAILNYRLAPAVSMTEIVEDNRNALIWLYHNAAALKFSKDRIFVSGSSAGGHLTATMISTDWEALSLPANIIKGGCALSGLYDLEPIRLCYLNEAVRLTPEQVVRFSPVNHISLAKTPLILSVGGDESDEFHRLQQEYAALLKGTGLPVQIVEQNDGHHFDAVDRLGDENNELGQAMLRMIEQSN